MTLADAAMQSVTGDLPDDRVTCWTLGEGQPPLFVEAKEGAFATLDWTVKAEETAAPAPKA